MTESDAPTPAGPESEQAVPADPAAAMAEWPTGRLLSMAARLVEHAWTERLERIGLTHAGLIALHLLADGPLSQTELARDARVEAQTMSRTLDRLQRDGLVERMRSPEDARRHVVTRTPAGMDVWQAAHRVEADFFPELGDPDALRGSLLEIITASSARRW